MIIICFDPGNHTGWILKDTENNKLIGGTLLEVNMYQQISTMFENYKPDVVVYESFNLYPGMSKHLAWNSFYPVEIIGIIKYICWKKNITTVSQAPSIKKFAGTIKLQDIQSLKHSKSETTPKDFYGEYTEHTKDALLHLMYFTRNNAIFK